MNRLSEGNDLRACTARDSTFLSEIRKVAVRTRVATCDSYVGTTCFGDQTPYLALPICRAECTALPSPASILANRLFSVVAIVQASKTISRTSPSVAHPLGWRNAGPASCCQSLHVGGHSA
jgi:hypothetical protein